LVRIAIAAEFRSSFRKLSYSPFLRQCGIVASMRSLPVIAENLIRAENTAVTPIDEIIKCQDESRFHRIVHTLCLHVSNPYGPPGRDCGSTPPDRRASTQRAEASAPQAI